MAAEVDRLVRRRCDHYQQQWGDKLMFRHVAKLDSFGTFIRCVVDTFRDPLVTANAVRAKMQRWGCEFKSDTTALHSKQKTHPLHDMRFCYAHAGAYTT